MAYEIPGFSFTLPADADFTASQYRFVNVNATGEAAVPTSGGRVVGVRVNKPNVGQATTVVQSGIVKVETGGTVTAGGDVMADSLGRAVDATSSKQKVGIALDGATTSGKFVTVLLQHGAATV